MYIEVNPAATKVKLGIHGGFEYTLVMMRGKRRARGWNLEIEEVLSNGEDRLPRVWTRHYDDPIKAMRYVQRFRREE